ncbi:MAG: M20/M25/M40 family metallo-hydrolase [Acidiferrobacteraceae bacterium]|jgi:putative aminopeptidase FrvX
MNQRQNKFLDKLLSIPTAPFREQLVRDAVVGMLDKRKVPYFEDPAGNLVIGFASLAAYQRELSRTVREPLRVLVAHMDHPGFHGLRWRTPKSLAVRWHGGSPRKHLAGSPVWLGDREGYVGQGSMTRVKMHRSGHFIETAEVRVDRSRLVRDVPAAELFGGFRFRAPVWRSGKRIYTKAADDLVGVFAIVETAVALFRKGAPRRPFVGLLTRGEEVGFVGAIAHLERKWLQEARRPVVFVSLETSRALDGARIGKGPVVRLGDRRTVFDAGALQVLAEVARRVLPGKHQKRIMDGGACEAAAATLWGVPSVGLSVPLGNYHNQGFEGGPDCRGVDGPAPEMVHEEDVAGLLALCKGLFARDLDWNHPWTAAQLKLRKNYRTYRKHL